MSDNNGSVDFKLTVNTVTFNLKVKLNVKLNVNRVFSQFPRPTTCQPSNVCYFQI